MRVVYTRKSDVFVPLHERTKIANRENGKLFISIHCNSNKVKQASGFETYILRPGKSKDAIRVAERENASVKYEEDGFKYEDLTAENFIELYVRRVDHLFPPRMEPKSHGTAWMENLLLPVDCQRSDLYLFFGNFCNGNIRCERIHFDREVIDIHLPL